MRQNAAPLGGHGGPLSRGIGASLPDRPSVGFGPLFLELLSYLIELLLFIKI
jgi:hypothetical protein